MNEDDIMLVMSKRKPVKRRGGWPKRDLVPVVLRIPPGLAEWLANLARGSRVRSRSQLIESWLEALRSAVAAISQDEGRLAPDEVLTVLGIEIGRELDRLGVKVPGTCYGWSGGGMIPLAEDWRKRDAGELGELVPDAKERQRNERKGGK